MTIVCPGRGGGKKNFSCGCLFLRLGKQLVGEARGKGRGECDADEWLPICKGAAHEMTLAAAVGHGEAGMQRKLIQEDHFENFFPTRMTGNQLDGEAQQVQRVGDNGVTVLCAV
jgi:hypothetical protein